MQRGQVVYPGFEKLLLISKTRIPKLRMKISESPGFCNSRKEDSGQLP